MEHTQPGASQSNHPLVEVLSPTFFQNVQHEIRTPLAIVLGYVELLQVGELGELTIEQHRAINIVAARAGRLRSLLDQVNVLLDTSLGQSMPQALDLAALVESVACRWRCFAQDLIFETRLCPGVSLNGDPIQLSQALDCLLDNAFKFTPRGGRIEISLVALCEVDLGTLTKMGQPWARLSVSDTGIGISERDIMCLLGGTLFYQADGGMSRCHTGCGLGLALVKAVARLHGGWLEIGSQPGQGSCFALMLPASG